MPIQTLVAAMMALVALESCLGVEHDLGAWEPGKEAEYMFWSEDHTFHPQDTLKFTYPAGVHNVLELNSEAAYDSCRVIDAIESYTEANAVVTLPITGKYYFVCGVPGHCQAGMRLTVNVVPAPEDAPPSSQTPDHPPPPEDSDLLPPPVNSGHPPPHSAPPPPANSGHPPPHSAPPPPVNTGHPPEHSASPANSGHPPANSPNTTASPPAPDSGAISLSSFSYIMGVIALVFDFAAY